ncbi:MAG TPA: L,D-transpeptidase [Pyrinomonadaceae bacterium]|nr:L,D-transpeptidase [Pyrinomonadaceae bacterium]
MNSSNSLRVVGWSLFHIILFVLILGGPNWISAQTAADRHESERSDKITGGRVLLGEFEPGQRDIRLTLNVPSFRLTLWQNGREVKSYYIGVGMKNYPIYIGETQAAEIIWNPSWIPPDSDWVSGKNGITPGAVIKGSDPRNPLGKMKIPLGGPYLIHEARSASDVGNLVSHGCVRMLRADLYDLANKIIAARSVPVSRKRIEAAKRSKRTLVVKLDQPIPVDINYDTLVVEERTLHIYPDVYERSTNRPWHLRRELESSGVDASQLDDDTMNRLLSKVTRRTQFAVGAASIAQGQALEAGQNTPLIPVKRKTARKR